MMRALRHRLRLLHLAYILARNDALFVFDAVPLPAPIRMLGTLFTHRKPTLPKGERLAAALQEMGPSFIKGGQSLSTRGDLIGEDIAVGLTTLQDRLPPFDNTLARDRIEAELGAPIAVLFRCFEPNAHAAASIAQVHFAVTPDGREVAVKVLRPGIEGAFARDLELMRWIAGKIEEKRPDLRRLKPRAVVETFAATIAIELDLRFEAAAAEELKENTRNDPDFYVPSVDWQRTSERVLTTERIFGFHAADREAIVNAGLDVTKITEKAATAFFNQVFRDGFFHADMHPGNLFVLPDGRLAPVDFGIMGRIDHQSQLYLAEILYGFLKGDYARVARIHREAGYIPPHVSVDLFAQACRAIGQPMMGKALSEISVGKLFGQLIHVARMFEMETQPHLLLLQKTMVTAEGVGRGLNPGVNMWQLAEPLITSWAKEHFSARAKIRNFAAEALEILEEAPRVLRELRDYLKALQAERSES
ncbi:MAG: 2-polyprenylphenol 6-hydroxylase [Alphaproteobacteria bacterium]